MKTEIILVPNTTEAATPMMHAMDLSAHYKQVLPPIDGVLSESLAGGRKWLKMLGRQLPVLAVDHTKIDQLRFDLSKIQGQTWVYVTDAGYPCIADPGSIIVKTAREMDYNVHLLPGTSAIIAAIALSGLSSQRFAFHGYLPREEEKLKRALKELESDSKPKDDSWQGAFLQVFIEVPHRFHTVFKTALSTLEDKTQLAIASEVGNQGQRIEVKSIGEWKKDRVCEEKESKVAVFLLINEEKAPKKIFKSFPSSEPYRKPPFKKTVSKGKREFN
jgi:16S rRNA (cytidine1402-2'-O)-methyltransferase